MAWVLLEHWEYSYSGSQAITLLRLCEPTVGLAARTQKALPG